MTMNRYETAQPLKILINKLCAIPSGGKGKMRKYRALKATLLKPFECVGSLSQPEVVSLSVAGISVVGIENTFMAVLRSPPVSYISTMQSLNPWAVPSWIMAVNMTRNTWLISKYTRLRVFYAH